ASTLAPDLNGDDLNGGDDDLNGDVTEKPLANPDSGVATLFEIKAKAFEMVKDEETGKDQKRIFAEGNLKLERDTGTGKCLVVIRDMVVGRVMFQAAIDDATTIIKFETTKGKVLVGTSGIVKEGNNPQKFLKYFLSAGNTGQELLDALEKCKKEAK
ncbi:MAG: hypothetical protein SGILL_009135, partial [Bacillariaceae sp.]